MSASPEENPLPDNPLPTAGEGGVRSAPDEGGGDVRAFVGAGRRFPALAPPSPASGRRGFDSGRRAALLALAGAALAACGKKGTLERPSTDERKPRAGG